MRASWSVSLLVLLGCSAGGAEAPPELLADSLVLFEMDSATIAFRDVAVDDGHRVWAITTTAPFAHEYAPDGRLLGRFGHEGGGPGELQAPWSVMVTGNRARPVEIHDLRARALVVYDSTFREVARRPVSSGGTIWAQAAAQTFGQMRWLERSTEGYVLFDQPELIMASRSVRRSVLVRLDSSAVTVDTLLDLRVGEPVVEVGTRPLEMMDLPFVAVCPSGEVLLLDSAVPVLMRFSAGGTLIQRDTLALPTRPLTEHDVRPWARLVYDYSAREGVGVPEGMTPDEAVDRLVRELRDWFGEHTPAAVGLLCDASGYAWIQEFSAEHDPVGRGPRWRIFDGPRLVTTVTLPGGFQPYALAGTQTFGVHTDDLGQQRVARVTLPSALQQASRMGPRSGTSTGVRRPRLAPDSLAPWRAGR